MSITDLLIYMHLTAVHGGVLNVYVGRSEGWLKVKTMTTSSRSSQVTKSVKKKLDFTIELKFENLVK